LFRSEDTRIKYVQTLAKRIFTDSELAADINKNILSDTDIADTASPALASIRAKIRKAGGEIKDKLMQFVRKPELAKYLSDSTVTIRSDRYVLPVKSEMRSFIPGFIHDQSGSGKTVFIEPLPVLELNNTLKTYKIEEAKEIDKILERYTGRVNAISDYIKETEIVLTELDVLFAKARYALSYNAVKPEINIDGYVRINNGAHPLISQKKVVPVSLALGREYRILMITGPNTGGKTVTLKLTGLLCLMAASGLFVPCTSADISLFDNVYADIGDEQSIELSLSAFSAHMSNVVNITNALTAKSLVLFDELGSGTDPIEGAAIALAVTDFIKTVGARTVITTHFDELKRYAVAEDGVENAGADFDPISLRPTYKLNIGLPGASNALAVARNLGLKPEIIKKAEDGISVDKLHYEKILNELEKARLTALQQEAEAAKLLKAAKESEAVAHAEKEKAEAFRKELSHNAKKETQRMVGEAFEEAKEIIRTLKAMLNAEEEADIAEAHRLKNKILGLSDGLNALEDDNIAETEDGTPLKVGDTVKVKTLGVFGVIAKLNGRNSATIQMGNMRSEFPLSVLSKVKKPKANDNKQLRSSLLIIREKGSEGKSTSVPYELNLIGKTAREAEEEIIIYLDKASNLRYNEVRIIHGHGFGVLKEKAREILKRSALVREFYDAPQNIGGEGATVVKLH
ncbi:MAG: Smr/MutS family protein, partial [Christensenellaceae bacterium]|nr:Smr/MutS family protein [Christensenellaceae bacterium]